MTSFETAGAVTAASDATTVTLGADTKGSYVELIASTSFDAKMVYVIIGNEGTNINPDSVIDIATGAAASEVVVIPDIMYSSGAGGKGFVASYAFRLDISSGTRIAARGEASPDGGGSEVNQVEVILSDTEVPLLTSPTVTTYGAVTGSTSPKGTAVDPGGSANTKGSYVELSSSVSATAEHAYLVVSAGGNTSRTTSDWLLDIATGAVSSEVVQIDNIYIANHSTGDQPTPKTVGPFPADLFQSQRVSVRAQSTNTDSADRLVYVTLMVTSGTVPSAGGGNASVHLAGRGGGLAG